MAEAVLDDLIAASQRRLMALKHQAAAVEAPPDFSVAALEELATSIEELHVAAEELRAQNDELAAAQRDLEAERRRYADLFELAPDPYVVTTPQAIIREANRAAVLLFGVEREYLVGKPLIVFAPERERNTFRVAVHDLSRSAAVAGRAWDLEIEPRHGHMVPVAVTVTALREGGEVTGLRWLLRDISERRRQEEAIRKANQELQSRVVELSVANRELESFGYSVSHDLRAPLRHVEGYTQIIADESGPVLNETSRGALERVRAATRTMGELIDALLKLSQTTEGGVARELVDLNLIVRSIAVDLAELAPERAVEWVVQDGVRVVGDRGLLRVAMHNLLDNAWKFTAKHPLARIEFGVVPHHGGRAYFVRDDGAGFEMNDPERLFGPFQRFHAREEYAGSGIGLATVQHIIRRHGGRVWVESAVERGTTVYFTLEGGAVANSE